MEQKPQLVRGLQLLIDSKELAGLTFRPRNAILGLDRLNDAITTALKKWTSPPRSAELIRGLLLLWHDHMDAAHSIAQSAESGDGSLLHAILHRREPDPGNAKYWFRHAGKHAAYPAIAKLVSELLLPHDPKLAANIVPEGIWDPFAFVDACESAEQKRSPESQRELLKQVQQREFKAFLHFLCE